MDLELTDDALEAARTRAHDQGLRYSEHCRALERGLSMRAGTYVCPPPGCALDPKPPPAPEPSPDAAANA